MGCKAFTPPLVGLAKELEGQPFHLVASHNQQGDREHVIAEIFANGLDVFAPNVSVTKSARHPGVKGTGYVPYYMLFDQHGDLVRHHQGGPYHGGDGDGVHDRIRELLKQVPVVYLGKEPFEAHAKLAGKIAKGKKLRGPLAELAGLVAAAPDDAELARLVAGVERHRDRLIADAETLLASEPQQARKRASVAAKDFAGTPWAEPLEALVATLSDGATLKRHQAAAKELGAVLKAYGKLDTVRGNAGAVLNPLDPEFRSANERTLGKLIARLEKLRAAHGDLPAGARAGELLALLGG